MALVSRPLDAIWFRVLGRSWHVVLVMHLNYGWHISRTLRGRRFILALAYLLVERVAISMADVVWTQSAFDFPRLLRKAREKTYLAVGWFNDRVFVSRPVGQQSVVDSSRTLLWVGRFSAVKDPFLAIDAFDLIDESLQIRLLMVGSGSMREAILRRVSQSPKSDRIEILPWVSRPELAGLFRASDALLHTARSEATPRIFLEAVASGLRLISLRRSDPECWGLHRGNQQVSLADPNQIAKAAEKVLGHSGQSSAVDRARARRGSLLVPEIERLLLEGTLGRKS